MMYIIGSLQQISTDYSGTLAFSLQLGIVVTSVFSVVFLFYTNSFLMRRRKKEFGLYNILGMEKRHLARLIFWETALMLAVSLTLGLAVGVLLDKLMHLVLSRLVGQAVSLTFAVSPGSMRYTAALISITFALILLNSVRQVYVARPVELLRSARWASASPKARWLLGLLGLISLGTGYWLSATVKDAGMMILFFFVAVLLVIAGTYLLFTSGSITLLKALRKNRRYYYKPDPLHQRIRHDLPHEAKRRGPCQRVHPIHHGAGDGVFDAFSVAGHGGHPQQLPAFGHRCAVRLHGCVRTGGRRG